MYLSLEHETAVAEFSQAQALFSPGTIACYHIALAQVADLSTGFTSAWDPLWMDWDCQWKQLWFVEGIEPPTWTMADQVQAAGLAGLLFPSTKCQGGTNLVLYPDLIESGLDVHDPVGQLPRSAESWR